MNRTGPSFEKAIEAETGDRQLDFGCALADGAFELSPKRELRWWPEDGLMRFFLTLLRRLQEFGTAPAMALEAYARVLDAPDAKANNKGGPHHSERTLHGK